MHGPLAGSLAPSEELGDESGNGQPQAGRLCYGCFTASQTNW